MAVAYRGPYCRSGSLSCDRRSEISNWRSRQPGFLLRGAEVTSESLPTLGSYPMLRSMYVSLLLLITRFTPAATAIAKASKLACAAAETDIGKTHAPEGHIRTLGVNADRSRTNSARTGYTGCLIAYRPTANI